MFSSCRPSGVIRVLPVSLRREGLDPIGMDTKMGSSVNCKLGWIRGCLLVIPREPALGILEQLRGVSLKSRQVMERVDAVENASVNETHKQITDVGPMFGLEEERIFAMKDGPFEGLLAEVIVQRRSRNSQK